MESLECLELPVFLENLEDPVSQERKDLQGLPDLKVDPECLVHLVYQASQEKEDSLDFRVCQDSKEKWDHQDLSGHKETKELRVFQDLRVLLALKDVKVPLELEANLETKEKLVYLDSLAPPEGMDYQESEDCLDHLDHRETLGRME